MSKNVFDILAIKQTKDFLLVKTAYMLTVIEHRALHPDTPLSPNLQEAWAEINSQERLSAYYRTCVAEDISDNNHFLNDHALKIPAYDAPDNTIDVFIPVDFVGIAKNENRKKHTIAELYELTTDSNKAFAATIDWSYFAQIITNLSNYHQRVGLTAGEVEDIVNYHSHHHPTLIVQISISFDQLFDFPRPEKQSLSEYLNKYKEARWAGLLENQHFSLKPNIKIDASRILSIHVMNNYLNSMRFDEYVEDYWPKKILFQPNVVPHEVTENCKPLAPTLQDLAQTEIKRLEDSWFSKGKMSALQKAARENDTAKIQEALTVRRFPLVDYFFGRTKLPTSSEKNCYEKDFKSSEQNRF